jgi:hypothetical protein
MVFCVLTPCSLVCSVTTGQDQVLSSLPLPCIEWHNFLSTVLTLIPFTLKMEAVYSPETLVSIYKTTQCHNPEDCNMKMFQLSTIRHSLLLWMLFELATCGALVCCNFQLQYMTVNSLPEWQTVMYLYLKEVNVSKAINVSWILRRSRYYILPLINVN